MGEGGLKSFYSAIFSEIEGLLLVWMLAVSFLNVCWPLPFDVGCVGSVALVHSQDSGGRAGTCLGVSYGRLLSVHSWDSEGSLLLGLIAAACAHLWSPEWR